MKRRLSFLALLAAGCTLASLCGGTSARAELIYGLANAGGAGGTLARFDSATPGTPTPIAQVTGITTGQTLVSIDFRPATGQLFGLGYNPTGEIGQLYTINLTTGVASTVGGTVTLTGSGTATGWDMDFNPTVDRIRVVNNNDTNFRLNPNDGTIAGTDTSLSPASVSVVGAGYTNSFAGATATTLYGYDFFNDSLVTIGGLNGVPSPNGGIVTQIGGSGIVTNGLDTLGFDISGTTGIAYLQTALAGGTVDNLYTVNLTTGAATLVGAFTANVRDIAVAVPEPGTYALLALGFIAGGFAWLRRGQQVA